MTDADVQVAGWVAQTSSTLLARMKTLEPESWGRFVHLYGPLIRQWCRQAGLQDADAADVGQDVFRAVAAAISNFRRDGGTFRGWLRTITRNKIRDLARLRARECQGQGGSDAQAKLYALADGSEPRSDAGQDHEEELSVLRRAVQMVLADFTQQTREAFLKVVQDGRDPVHVAEELGTTVNVVYLAKSRVMRRMREEFGELLDR